MKDQNDRIEMDGVVIEASNSKFTVQINEIHMALCTLSGKMRINFVRIIVGDKVKVELGAYEPTKGRIIYRYKASDK